MSDRPKVRSWARLWPTIRPPRSRNLRAGAWYPVVKDDIPDRVSIKLGDTVVDVPRRVLEIRRTRPDRFTVVHRTGYNDDPRRQSLHNLGKHYTVCPICGCRFALFGEPTKTQCPECKHEGDIAWWET